MSLLAAARNHFIKTGRIPVDITTRLLGQGVDVAAMERRLSVQFPTPSE